MTACSHTSIPSSITLTCSGNAGPRLVPVEDLQQDSCPTTFLESLSLIQSDGNSLTGDSSIKKEPSSRISILTSLLPSVLQFSKQLEKSEENLDSYRLQLSELKELSLQFSQLAADIGVTTTQMESMLTKLSTCLR